MRWFSGLLVSVAFLCQACGKEGGQGSTVDDIGSSRVGEDSRFIEIIHGGWRRGDEQLMIVGSQIWDDHHLPIKARVEIYFQKEGQCYQEVFVTDMLKTDGSNAPPKLKSYGGPNPFVMAITDITKKMENCPKFKNIQDIPDEVIKKMKLNTWPDNAGVAGTDIYNLPSDITEEQLIFAYASFDHFVYEPEGYTAQPVVNILTGKITGIALPDMLIAQRNVVGPRAKVGIVDLKVQRRKVEFHQLEKGLEEAVGKSLCLMFRRNFSIHIKRDRYSYFLETINAYHNNDYSYFEQFEELSGCLQ